MVVNHDNVCFVNGYSLVKNFNGGVSVKYDSLVSMPSPKDVTLNSLHGL